MLYAIAAYVWWGSVVPIYFWRLKAVAAWDLLALRILLGLPLMAVLLTVAGQWRVLLRVPRIPGAVTRLPITALLLGANWTGYIYAIVSARTLEASLGYYMTPLVSVALGALVLGERLSRRQLVAVTLAAVGVAVMTAEALMPVEGRPTTIPWITALLAGSFGFYGLLRKQSGVPAMVGLAWEMIMLLPIAAGAFVWRSLHHGAAADILALPSTSIALITITGIVTLAPLIWFAAAASRLPLATVGLLQYIAPTGQFVLALTLFQEKLTPGRLVGFVIVWIAVGLYCRELVAVSRAAASSPSTDGDGR